MNKKQARKRRGLKTKAIINQSNRARLAVHRTALHIYAQVILRGEKGDTVLASASSLDKELKGSLKGNKCEIAAKVGELLAQRVKKQKNFPDVAFDRAGYHYHGRVKALAEAARQAGLIF